MNNRELENIIDQIKVGEGIKIAAIAKTAKVNRSYLSTIINSEDTKEVEDAYIGKLSKAFPQYFNGQQKPTVQESDLDEIRASLEEIRRHTRAILTGQTAGQQVMMKSLDRLEENQEGTLAAEADKLALMIEKRLNSYRKDKKAGAHK